MSFRPLPETDPQFLGDIRQQRTPIGIAGAPRQAGIDEGSRRTMFKPFASV